MSLASLAYRDIEGRRDAASAIASKNRSLRATIDDVRLYGGQGRGVVTRRADRPVRGGRRQPVARRRVRPAAAKDAAGFDWIDGKAQVQIAVGGSGATERAIVETLYGKAEFGFADGAIVGFNIPQMIRGLSQGRISGFSRTADRDAPISARPAPASRSATASPRPRTCARLSPLMRLTGAGTVNLGQRQIDAELRPKLVGSLAGQGAQPAT